MIKLREDTDPHARSPFQQWLEELNARAAAKVTVALTRLEQGNVSNVKAVGGGVLEQRIDYGPGCRVYRPTVIASVPVLVGRNDTMGGLVWPLAEGVGKLRRVCCPSGRTEMPCVFPIRHLFPSKRACLTCSGPKR